jgi:hypothetical protein
MQILKRLKQRQKEAGFAHWAKSHRVAQPVPGRPGVLAFKDADSSGVSDDSAMTADFVISTAGKDRHGDSVQSEGCKETLNTYLDNPIVLLNHQCRNAPIATARRPDGSVCLTIEPTRILSRAHFSNASDDSRQTYALIKAGIFRGASIGFRPRLARRLKAPYADQTSDLPRDLIDFEEDRWSLVFLKWELLEWSVVGIPANPDALVIQSANEILGKGVLDSRPLSRQIQSHLQPLARPRRLWETHMTKSLSAAVSGQSQSTATGVKNAATLAKELEDQTPKKAVQALLVPKETYAEVTDAAAKVEELGLDASDVETFTLEEITYWAFIQFEPDLCGVNTAEYEILEGGLIAVLCSQGDKVEEGKTSRVVAKPSQDGGEEGDTQGPTPGDKGGPTPGDKKGPTPGDKKGPTPGDKKGPTPGDKGGCNAGVCGCKQGSSAAREKKAEGEAGSESETQTSTPPVLPGVALAKALAHILTTMAPLQENAAIQKACAKTIRIWKGVCSSEYPEETFAWPEEETRAEADSQSDEEEDSEDESDDEAKKHLLVWHKMSKKRRGVCRDVADWLGDHADEVNLTRAQKAACKFHHAALVALLAEVEESPEEESDEESEKALAALLDEAMAPFRESTQQLKTAFAQLTGVRVG